MNGWHGRHIAGAQEMLMALSLLPTDRWNVGWTFTVTWSADR